MTTDAQMINRDAMLPLAHAFQRIETAGLNARAGLDEGLTRLTAQVNRSADMPIRFIAKMLRDIDLVSGLKDAAISPMMQQPAALLGVTNGRPGQRAKLSPAKLGR